MKPIIANKGPKENPIQLSTSSPSSLGSVTDIMMNITMARITPSTSMPAPSLLVNKSPMALKFIKRRRMVCILRHKRHQV